MVFSSIEFIFIFLPAFLLLYYLTPGKAKNITLFLGSVVFYAVGTLDHPWYILLLLASVLVNFLLGRGIERWSTGGKLLLVLGILYNFGWLFVFKYADFLFAGVNKVLGAVFPGTGARLEPLRLVLPVGISFYTFQVVSYLVDIRRGKCRAERSFINLGVYVCMFPQLIAGPIVTYSSISEQLHKPRPFSAKALTSGLQAFVFGLGLKVLLANRLGGLWTALSTIGYESISTPLAWMGLIAYSFQLYFDFFGYSLMAIGLGRMLGFHLPLNFRHPYLSRSMTEFWRRWHVTLGSWFREYVYIPLGGSRRGRTRMVLNLLIVWLMTGLWHGAHMNFLLWGFILFLLLASEKLWLGERLRAHPVLAQLRMLLLIPLTWAVFAITDLSQLATFFSRLFPFIKDTAAVVYRYDFLKYGREYGLLLLAGILFSTRLPYRLLERYQDKAAGTVFLLLVFWGSVYCMYKGLNDPFLYFRF
ncbi:MAG: MBOAT family O-acyltransferase [Oscillospiraceae bacterium]